MTVLLAPQPLFTAFNNQGQFLVGGLLYTYAAGSSAPQATYIDSTQGTPNTNPIVLNAAGQASVWLVTGQAYKLVLTDSAGNQQWSVDNVSGGVTLTAATVGALIYPMSSAETNTGTTPSNYIYPPLNVFRYGAAGNGNIDDTAAINAAITVARQSGGVVVLPAGTYKTSYTLATGDYAGVYLQGAGAGLTTIVPTAAVTGSVISFGASGTTYQGLQGISINCANATSATAMTVNNIEYFYADDFLISQANIGIYVNGGVVQFYTRWNINRTGAYGVLIVGGNDQYFDNGVMSSVGYTQGVAGFNLQSSGGVWLSNLDIISQGSGIIIDPTNGQSVDWLFAVNVACDTNSASGIVISPTGSGTVYGCDFTACWTASNTAFGVYFGGTGTVSGCRFNGLRVQNNQQHGIVLSSGLASLINTSFENCDITGNSQQTSGTYHGVAISAGVGSFSLVNNRIGAEDGYLTTQGYGILINTGASTNYKVVANDVRGNVNGGISDGGSGSVKTVHSNLGYNPLPANSITVGASPFSYFNQTGGPIAIHVYGGTVSSITVNSYSIGSATAGQFILPQGDAITVTYSVAPTMVYYGTI
jgi:hypothetical protein